MANDSITTMVEDLLVCHERGVNCMTPIFSAAALVLGANEAGHVDEKQLCETLSRHGHLRKKDFNQMMTAVTGAQNNRGKIGLLLRDFLDHQRALMEHLGRHFSQIRSCMQSGDLAPVKPLLNRILDMTALQEQARHELEAELAEQEKEQQEIDAGIKSLLHKGSQLRVGDFKEMLAGIKRQSKDRMEQNRLRRQAVSQMLAGYKEQRLKSVQTPAPRRI